MIKKLIINADDYGISREVNLAIEDLVGGGFLENVSLLANFPFYEEAAGFLLARPQCSTGVHLNIVEGRPLAPVGQLGSLLGADGKFAGLREVLVRWLQSPLAVSKAVETEWRAQIELLLKTGLTISHADSHQHIHAFPPFWKILPKLCREYDIPGARLPRERNDLRLRRAAAFALSQAANISKAIISTGGLAVNDHFLGFKRAGNYSAEAMIEDVGRLENGVTELIVHPSTEDGLPYPELRGRLEYQALTSPGLRRQFADSEVELTTWTEFSKTAAKPAKIER